MHTEYISVNRATIKKLIDHDGCAVAVGTTSVRTLESLYHIESHWRKIPMLRKKNCTSSNGSHTKSNVQIPPVVALQKILGYLDRNGLKALHSSTQIIIAPGYQYKIVKCDGDQLSPAAKYAVTFGFRLREGKLAHNL